VMPATPSGIKSCCR